MRIRVATILLALVCLSAAQLRAGSTEQTGTVSGSVSSRSGALTLEGTVVGSIAGSLRVILRTTGERADSGEWILTTEKGALSGTVVGGAVGLTADGRFVGISNLKVQISGGTGAYAGIADKSGTMNVRFTRADAFDADLSLSF